MLECKTRKYYILKAISRCWKSGYHTVLSGWYFFSYKGKICIKHFLNYKFQVQVLIILFINYYWWQFPNFAKLICLKITFIVEKYQSINPVSILLPHVIVSLNYAYLSYQHPKQCKMMSLPFWY